MRVFSRFPYKKPERELTEAEKVEIKLLLRLKITSPGQIIKTLWRVQPSGSSKYRIYKQLVVGYFYSLGLSRRPTLEEIENLDKIAENQD